MAKKNHPMNLAGVRPVSTKEAPYPQVWVLLNDYSCTFLSSAFKSFGRDMTICCYPCCVKKKGDTFRRKIRPGLKELELAKRMLFF